MRVEVLYIDGCPNVRPAIERLKDVLQAQGLDWPVIEIKVLAEAMAMEVRFLGSPTVRINDMDIEPSARSRSGFGMICRTYDGSGGVPPKALIRSAITEAAKK